MPLTADPRLCAAADAAAVPYVMLCGGLVLEANGFLVCLEDEALLVYDNNGRAAGHFRAAPAGEALQTAVREIARRAPIRPQVRIERR